MKPLIILVTIFGLQAQAVTKINFTLGGMQVIGMIKPTDWDGSSDDDGERLYQLMNVSESDSMLGPGKAVKDKAQFLTITCAKNSKECSIVLRKSPNTKIDSRRKSALFSVKGAEAQFWLDQFHIPEDVESLDFISTDGKFRLHLAADDFSLKLSDQ